MSVTPKCAKFLKKIQSLGVVGNKNHLVRACGFDVSQKAVKHGKFAGKFGLKNEKNNKMLCDRFAERTQDDTIVFAMFFGYCHDSSSYNH